MVEVEDPTEALLAAHAPAGRVLPSRERDDVVEPLVVPLVMVVLDILANDRSQVCASPIGITLRRHSALIDRTNLSACAFRFGLRRGGYLLHPRGNYGAAGRSRGILRRSFVP
jgi:hypothetical protein